MNNGSRFAGLWGVLFPIVAVILFSVILGFTGRSAAPDPNLAGQNAAASQSAAQSGGNTSGGGNSTTMAGSGMASTATTGTASSGTASSGAAASGTAAAGTVPTATGAGASTSGTASTAPAAGTAVQASADGAQVYTANCASCHGPAGAGVPGAFPPLAGNKAILGSEKYVSDVLLYGLQGQINAGGQNYNGVMPAWAATLSDAEIAAVLTHIRSTWGNAAPAVTADTVKTERATPLTAQQVLAERPQ
ncbi:c-type cytochrome [Deinococcus sp. UYEF24]